MGEKNKKPHDAIEAKLKDLNFEDFKKELITYFQETEDHLYEIVKDYGKNDDQVVDYFGKQFNRVDSAMGVLLKRIEALEAFVLFHTIQNLEYMRKGRLSFEKKKEIAKLLNINWRKKNDY